MPADGIDTKQESLADILIPHSSPQKHQRENSITYPSNPEIPEHTSCNSTSHASVLDLCWPRVGVHLRELELGLGAHTLRQRGVANNVAKRLSVIEPYNQSSSTPSVCKLNLMCDRIERTSPARASRTSCAWCDRGSHGR